MTAQKENQELFIGIDVSKEYLDIAGLDEHNVLHLAYTAQNVQQLVDTLSLRTVRLIVLEATGGLEMDIASALYESHLPVCVINPKQVRDFARSLGQLSKCDTLDAKVLARFGKAIRPEQRALPDASLQAFKALLQRRRQVQQLSTMEKNRLSRCKHKVVYAQLERHLCYLQEELAVVETQIRLAIQEAPAWQEKQERLSQVPGVGPVTSQMIVSHLPELGTLT